MVSSQSHKLIFQINDSGTVFTLRGLINVGCLIIVCILITAVFAVYPIVTFYTSTFLGTNGAYNLGGINGTGQIPDITNHRHTIDPDTPSSVYTRTGFDGEEYTLTFSDEFNQEGR